MKAIITAIGDRDHYAAMRSHLVGLMGEFRHESAKIGQYQSGMFISDTPIKIQGASYRIFNFHRVSVKSVGEV